MKDNKRMYYNNFLTKLDEITFENFDDLFKSTTKENFNKRDFNLMLKRLFTTNTKLVHDIIDNGTLSQRSMLVSTCTYISLKKIIFERTGNYDLKDKSVYQHIITDILKFDHFKYKNLSLPACKTFIGKISSIVELSEYEDTSYYIDRFFNIFSRDINYPTEYIIMHLGNMVLHDTPDSYINSFIFYINRSIHLYDRRYITDLINWLNVDEWNEDSKNEYMKRCYHNSKLYNASYTELLALYLGKSNQELYEDGITLPRLDGMVDKMYEYLNFIDLNIFPRSEFESLVDSYGDFLDGVRVKKREESKEERFNIKFDDQRITEAKERIERLLISDSFTIASFYKDDLIEYGIYDAELIDKIRKDDLTIIQKRFPGLYERYSDVVSKNRAKMFALIMNQYNDFAKSLYGDGVKKVTLLEACDNINNFTMPEFFKMVNNIKTERDRKLCVRWAKRFNTGLYLHTYQDLKETHYQIGEWIADEEDKNKVLEFMNRNGYPSYPSVFTGLLRRLHMTGTCHPIKHTEEEKKELA